MCMPTQIQLNPVKLVEVEPGSDVHSLAVVRQAVERHARRDRGVDALRGRGDQAAPVGRGVVPCDRNGVRRVAPPVQPGVDVVAGLGLVLVPA